MSLEDAYIRVLADRFEQHGAIQVRTRSCLTRLRANVLRMAAARAKAQRLSALYAQHRRQDERSADF